MKTNLSNIAKNVAKAASKRAPEIWLGFGIAAGIATTVLAVKATPKALKAIEEKKEELEVEELTVVDTVKTTWKYYVPAAVTGVTSAVCLINSSSISSKRTAALATAYKITETAYSEYKDKVVETIGEKKEQAIKTKVAEEKIKQHPVEKQDVIVTGRGRTLCFDPYSGRYFEGDIEEIKRAINELNRRMTTDMSGTITLNEYYVEIGIEPNEVGNYLGWCINNGTIKFNFSSHLTNKQEPVLVLDFDKAPMYDFDKY